MVARPQGIPDRPGCYRFYADDTLIYVGKALRLSDRLASYWSSAASSKQAEIVSVADTIDWIVCANELEALLLEATLVRTHQPRYNVMLREAHPYASLAITDEIWPKVRVSYEPRRGEKRYGPYPKPRVARSLYDLAKEAFGVRTCSTGVYQKAEHSGIPCLLADIGRCSAPCVGRISRPGYLARVEELRAFLSGKPGKAVARLHDEMADAAEQERYEHAARVRDQIRGVEEASMRQHVTGLAGRLQVIAVAGDGPQYGAQIFDVTGGAIYDGRSFLATGDSSEAVVARLLDEIATGDPARIPPVILVSHDVEATYAAALSAQSGRPVHVRKPSRGAGKAVVDLAHANAANLLARDQLRRASDPASRANSLNDLGAALGITPPWRIECFDISHTMGQEIVASMVVLEDGLPAKSRYRHYIIRGLTQQDDFASMYQVVSRRYKNAAGKDGDLPGLALIDGGPGQVAAAQRALDELGIDIPVVGLAKRYEELWPYGAEEPVILDRASEALYVVQRARDEAHRFAITHHRKRRQNAMTKSALDDIPGIGPARRVALLKEFKTLKAIKAASVDELVARGKIPRSLAEAIVSGLRSTGAHDAPEH